jgi:hypothetical protein
VLSFQRNRFRADSGPDHIPDCGVNGRIPVLVLYGDHAAVEYEALYGVKVSFLGRVVQRQESLFVKGVWVASGSQQELTHLKVSATRGDVEDGVAVLMHAHVQEEEKEIKDQMREIKVQIAPTFETNK